MTIRRTVFQPDLEVELPEDEEALLDRDGLLLAVGSPAPAKPTVKTGANLAAVAEKEAPTDGGK
ncbi:MAG: hypothetical protein ACRDRN_20645 [Sciscionella sp.]